MSKPERGPGRDVHLGWSSRVTVDGDCPGMGALQVLMLGLLMPGGILPCRHWELTQVSVTWGCVRKFDVATGCMRKQIPPRTS